MSSKLANQLLNEFSAVFEGVSIKTFFGGFSINSQDTIFGWVGQTDFYLRGHSSYRDFFVEQDMEPLVLPAGVTTKLLDYYRVGAELLNDRPKLYSIVEMVIECTKQDKQEKNRVKELRIKELPNMTRSLERLLFNVEIIDIETFQEVGYLEAFNRIKQYKKDISINVLFSLYGAWHRMHVGTLSASTKKEIELSYQRFLDEDDKKVICH